MTTSKTLLALAAAGAILASAAPALSQTAPGMPGRTDQMQQQRSGTGPGGERPEAMREMMREMMDEMMRRGGPRADGEWRDRSDRYGERGERKGRYGMMHGDRMGRYGMMQGDRMGRRGPMHGAGMRLMFAVMDADGNGALSLEEVQDFHERIFNAVDDDGDGSITMDEIESFVGKSDDD